MRLIIVHQDPLPSPNPESLQVIHTASALAKSAEVRLLTSKGVNTAPSDYYNLTMRENLHIHFLKALRINFHALRISWNLPFYIASLIAILWMAKKHKVDVLLIRNLKLGHFLLKWRSFLKLPSIIFETHEIFALSFQDEIKIKGKNPGKEKKLLRRESYVYENADGLICITQHLADMIKDRFKTKGRILVAPDGVDPEQCNKKESGAINSHDIKKRKTLLYLGSLHHWKGMEILISAMQYLPDASLLIAGGNIESIRNYQSLAKKLGVDTRVQFEGFVPPGKRFGYISRADICVLPLKSMSISSYFTSPLKLFEYMAAGKPIVASDLPAIREVLSNRVNSILVPPDNPEKLAEGIRILLENPSLCEKIAGQAFLDAQKYTWDKRAEKIIDFIKGCG